MSVNDTTLTKCKYAVERLMQCQVVTQKLGYLFESVDTIWCRCNLFISFKPSMKQKPTFEFSVITVLRQKATEFLGWLIFAFKGGIDQSELHYFVKNLPKVPHLVFHDTGV